MSQLPVALSIAGSDSSAGAGVQADLKTFSAVGVYGVTTITCVVAEIPGKVSRIEPVSAGLVRDQIEVLAGNFPIAAIKTGLLYSAEIISTVAEALQKMNRMVARHIPLVVDPVFVATSGDALLEPAGIETYEKELFPSANLITPNLDEAGRLVGTKINDQQSMRSVGKALQDKFGTGILLKGGHLAGDHAIDLLFADGRVVEFSAPKVSGIATHGTGCTYSAAITAGLAKALPIEKAISEAKKFVTAAITQRLRWESKSGRALDALNHSL